MFGILLLNACCVRVIERIFGRPVYKQSTLWTMLAKRDCEVNGHPVVLECLSQVFRRPFGVPFSIFRDIVETARAWRSMAVDQERKLGDDQIDCVGTPRVEGIKSAWNAGKRLLVRRNGHLQAIFAQEK